MHTMQKTDYEQDLHVADFRLTLGKWLMILISVFLLFLFVKSQEVSFLLPIAIFMASAIGFDKKRTTVRKEATEYYEQKQRVQD